jgi:archaellum component FlaC
MSENQRQHSLRLKMPLSLDDVANKLSASITQLANEQAKSFATLTSTLKGIQETQKQLVDTTDGLKQQINTLQQKYQSVADGNQQTQSEVIELSSTVNRLNLQLNQLRQERLQQNLVITGFPFGNDANSLCELVINLAKNIGIEITNSNITNVFQIKTNRGHKHIVKLNSADLKNQFLVARRGRSIYSDEIGVNGQCTQIFLTEDLTVHTQKTFYHARKLVKEAGFLRVVTQNGIIYAKQTKESPSIKIQSIDQINNLLAYHKPYQQQPRGAEGTTEDLNEQFFDAGPVPDLRL